jgi:hypothetical protein
LELALLVLLLDSLAKVGIQVFMEWFLQVAVVVLLEIQMVEEAQGLPHQLGPLLLFPILVHPLKVVLLVLAMVALVLPQALLVVQEFHRVAGEAIALTLEILQVVLVVVDLFVVVVQQLLQQQQAQVVQVALVIFLLVALE